MTIKTAWIYECASWRNGDGLYAGWTEHISFAKPCMPEGSIRNLREVTITPPPADIDEKSLEFARRIAVLQGRDHSHYVSRVQVAVREAMDWARGGHTKTTD